jgi:hypothetical protein
MLFVTVFTIYIFSWQRNIPGSIQQVFDISKILEKEG